MSASGYTGNPPGSGGGGSGAVDSVNGRTGAVVLTKTDVGLSSADNTADTAKPVSTAQQTALNLKANLAGPTFTGTVAGITASMVGLGNVTNTSDANKPVSTAQQTALNLKADLASPTFTGTPAVPTAAPGTNTTQVASTAYVTAAVAAGGGGGGGTAPTFARAHITSGDVTPASSGGVFVPVTGLSISLAAVAGDNVEITASMLVVQNSTEFYDLAILVGGSIVRYASTGTGTGSGAGEGDPSMYPMSGVTIKSMTPSWGLTLASGDLSGGTVTFALAFKGPGAAGKVFASTNYPFRWRVRNDHQ
jgi:hypothetical protein